MDHRRDRSFVTGQWDNNHPVKRLTIEVTVFNDSNETLDPTTDIDVSLFNSNGDEMLYCVNAEDNKPLPTAPPGGSATYLLTTFVEPNQFVGEMRVEIFGTTVRRCFARNNRADVVGCG